MGGSGRGCSQVAGLASCETAGSAGEGGEPEVPVQVQGQGDPRLDSQQPFYQSTDAVEGGRGAGRRSVAQVQVLGTGAEGYDGYQKKMATRNGKDGKQSRGVDFRSSSKAG